MNPVLLRVVVLWIILGGTIGICVLVRTVFHLDKELNERETFGFVSTAYAVIIGLLVFFASQHFIDARGATEIEASAMAEIFDLSTQLDEAVAAPIQHAATCYVHSVIDDDWPAGEAGEPEGAESTNARDTELRDAINNVAGSELIWEQMTNAALEKRESRQLRLLFSRTAIPDVLWIVIFGGAAMITALLFFLINGNIRIQALMLGVIILALTGVVGTLTALDSPFRGPGLVEPNAMQQTLIVIENASDPDSAAFDECA